MGPVRDAKVHHIFSGFSESRVSEESCFKKHVPDCLFWNNALSRKMRLGQSLRATHPERHNAALRQRLADADRKKRLPDTPLAVNVYHEADKRWNVRRNWRSHAKETLTCVVVWRKGVHKNESRGLENPALAETRSYSERRHLSFSRSPGVLPPTYAATSEACPSDFRWHRAASASTHQSRLGRDQCSVGRGEDGR